MCLGRLCANMWGEPGPRPAQADSWQQSAETAEYAEPMTWTGYEQAACAARRDMYVGSLNLLPPQYYYTLFGMLVQLCSGTHRQNAPMTVIVTSPCLLELQCIHRPTLPICRYVTCHEVILTDDQPCPR